MKLFAINGSPRKKWNTAVLLEKALEGAAAAGAETEIVHLYDLDYRGCTSCFACKMVGGKSEGRCAMRDGLTPVLKKIEEEAGALIMGTPIYFWSMTGEMRSFLERLMFAPVVYSVPARSLFPRRIRTAMLYTMNAPEDMCRERGYGSMFKAAEMSLTMIFGSAESFYCYDTCQFPDYSKVVMEYFDPVKKAARRTEAFPEDCARAFEFGKKLVSET